MIGTYFLANVFISKPILFLLSSLFERKEVKMKRSLFKRGGEFLTVFQIPEIFYHSFVDVRICNRATVSSDSGVMFV